MAYLMRSMAIVGIIALNSPIHGGNDSGGGSGGTTREIAGAVAQLQPHAMMNSISAAREATQIVAGLDPATRSRMLQLAIAAAGAGGKEHEAAARTR